MVLLFTLVISLLAGLLFGLIPVFKYAGAERHAALRAGGRTLSQSKERHRARNVLVVVQVALALVLLIGSGLMIRTFQALRHVQPGFTNPASLQTLRIFIPETQVKEPERVTHAAEMREGRRDPRCSSAALPTPFRPMATTALTSSTPRTGRMPKATAPAPPLQVRLPRLLSDHGNPFLAGRDLTWTDIYEKRSVVTCLRNPRPRPVARPYRGARQTDSRKYESPLARNRGRGRQ